MNNLIEFNDFITEKKVSKTNLQDSWELNEPLNWSPVPDESKGKGSSDGEEKYYKNARISAIQIGDASAVEKFRDWNGKYWRKKKNKDQKYEP